MYSGEWTGTMCLTEPQAGTAVGDLTSVATPIEGTDEYSIVGNKIFISAGDHDMADNIIHLVLARVPGDAPGTKGISLFAVPKYRFDKDGNIGERNDMYCTAIEHKMGIHASPTCSLSFGDEKECRGYLIGERSRGIIHMFQMMNEARIMTGVQGVASANAAYQLALTYAKERIQSPKITDRSPDAKSVAIIEHPDVRRNLMLSKAIAEGIRSMIVETATYADRAANDPDEAVRTKANDLFELLTPICKAYSTDMGFKVTELAIQVHGGYGYIGEYEVEQYMRDLKIASLYEGTNGVQALDLLGRKMRMKGGALFMTWLQDMSVFLESVKSNEALSDIAIAVDKAKNSVAGAAMHFQSNGKAKFEESLLGATPFLEAMGNVHVAKALLHQAQIASDKLAELAPEGNADELAKGDDEIKFYAGKIHTARFFANSILPHTVALTKSIQSNDRSALDIVL
jgi:alkylation response protein AidB-like acyl-CoA dehydrogenase